MASGPYTFISVIYLADITGKVQAMRIETLRYDAGPIWREGCLNRLTTGQGDEQKNVTGKNVCWS